MCLTMFFASQIAKMFRYIFQKKENSPRTLQWHSKQRFLKLQQDFMDTVYFLQLLYQMYLNLVAYYLSSYHEKAINALHELA